MGKNAAVIVAAGLGTRMGSATPKQFITINNTPVLALTMLQFQYCSDVDTIIPVIPADYLENIQTEIIEKYKIDKAIHPVAGGKERQDSVRNGVENLPDQVEIVSVHDGVRPFIRRELISKSFKACEEHPGAIVALKTRDTIKKTDERNIIYETIDREHLWQAQTPQTFRIEFLQKAIREAEKTGFYGTDESMLAERLQIPVAVIPGDAFNIKITTPEDLLMAESFYPKFKEIDHQI